MMRKYRCPQCDIPSMYVKNADGERLFSVCLREWGGRSQRSYCGSVRFDLTEVFLPRMLMAWGT